MRRFDLGGLTAIVIGVVAALGWMADNPCAVARAAANAAQLSPIKIEAERTQTGMRVDLRL